MTRIEQALQQATRAYNRAQDDGYEPDPALAAVLFALLRQNELLEELVSRTTPL